MARPRIRSRRCIPSRPSTPQATDLTFIPSAGAVPAGPPALIVLAAGGTWPGASGKRRCPSLGIFVGPLFSGLGVWQLSSCAAAVYSGRIRRSHNEFARFLHGSRAVGTNPIGNPCTAAGQPANLRLSPREGTAMRLTLRTMLAYMDDVSIRPRRPAAEKDRGERLRFRTGRSHTRRDGKLRMDAPKVDGKGWATTPTP